MKVWKGEETGDLEEFIKKTLGVASKPKRLIYVGSSGQDVVIAEMDMWVDEQAIMKKQVGLEGSKVFMDHNLTKKEREILRKLREIER